MSNNDFSEPHVQNVLSYNFLSHFFPFFYISFLSSICFLFLSSFHSFFFRFSFFPSVFIAISFTFPYLIPFLPFFRLVIFFGASIFCFRFCVWFSLQTKFSLSKTSKRCVNHDRIFRQDT